MRNLGEKQVFEKTVSLGEKMNFENDFLLEMCFMKPKEHFEALHAYFVGIWLRLSIVAGSR